MSFETTVALLIFCLDNLSFGITRLLKVPYYYYIVVNSPFMSINICFIYLGTPVLGAYMLMSIVSSSCIDHFYHYIIPSLYFVTDLCFKCILSHTSIATPTFLLFPFA